MATDLPWHIGRAVGVACSPPTMTKAHSAEITIRLIETWPDHEPRKSDPYYKYFRKAKARLKKDGLLKCVVDSDYHAGQIELHHWTVEFAHINDVDLAKYNRLYGLQLDDAAFRRYVEGPGNLEPLCTLHHRGQEGVHQLSEPQWRVLRVAKAGTHIAVALANRGGIPIPDAGRLRATV